MQEQQGQREQQKTNIQELVAEINKSVRAFEKLRFAAIEKGGVYRDEKVDTDKVAVTTLYGLSQQFGLTVKQYEDLQEKFKAQEKELIEQKSKVATLEKEKANWKEKADKLQLELKKPSNGAKKATPPSKVVN